MNKRYRISRVAVAVPAVAVLLAGGVVDHTVPADPTPPVIQHRTVSAEAVELAALA